MDRGATGKAIWQLLSVAVLTAVISLGLSIPILAASGVLSAPGRHLSPDSTGPDGDVAAATSSSGEGSISAFVTAADNVDADLDGLLDNLETASGCAVGNADSDGDGLTDGQEVVLLGTDCSVGDSDGDGFSDAFEMSITGSISSASATTLVDADSSYPQPPTSPTSTWATDQWAGFYIIITGGPGAGQVRAITGNTADTLTVSAAWSTIPDATSTYVIQKVGTDPLVACAADSIPDNEDPDPLPPDINDDQSVNLFDVYKMVDSWLADATDPRFDPRLDLNADGAVNVLDVFQLVPFWLQACTP